MKTCILNLSFLLSYVSPSSPLLRVLFFPPFSSSFLLFPPFPSSFLLFPPLSSSGILDNLEFERSILQTVRQLFQEDLYVDVYVDVLTGLLKGLWKHSASHSTACSLSICSSPHPLLSLFPLTPSSYPRPLPPPLILLVPPPQGTERWLRLIVPVPTPTIPAW